MKNTKHPAMSSQMLVRSVSSWPVGDVSMVVDAPRMAPPKWLMPFWVPAVPFIARWDTGLAKLICGLQTEIRPWI